MGVRRIFSRGALGGFPKFLQGGTKWWYLFFPTKKYKNNFFAENFKIQGGKALPAPPSDTYGHSQVDHSGTVGASGSTVCFLRMVWYWLHLLNRIFNIHLIGFTLRATKREWKSKKIGLLWLSKSKLKSVYVANKRKYTAAGREVQIPWGGIHKWRKAEQGDRYTDW